jgi:hypothetical protein
MDRAPPPLLAPAAARMVPGVRVRGIATWIALSKYAAHLLPYRLEQMPQRYGRGIQPTHDEQLDRGQLHQGGGESKHTLKHDH